jgi:hypothetical protein
MVELPPAANGDAMTWRAVNCLYAGWKTLLSGTQLLLGADVARWRNFWKLPEGDVSLWQSWGTALPAEPGEATPRQYHTQDTGVAFAATYSPGYLGCDLAQLPWVRPHWLDLTTQRAAPDAADVLAPDAPPDIPKGGKGLYHGERLDLDTTDLGARLREVQQKQKLADVVVMHLRGTGRRKMSPVRVEKVGLFLYFEPPAAGAEPLVLVPDVSGAPDGNALIEVAGGNLGMIGGDVRCPDFKSALLPRYLLAVTGGTLTLSDTRLQGPILDPPDSYRGLVRVEGTGRADRAGVPVASFNQCTLLTSGTGIHCAGAGLRVHLEQSLLVTTGRGVSIQPAQPQKEAFIQPAAADSFMEKQGLYSEADLNTQVTADHCTIAAREAAVYVEDLPSRLDAQPFRWSAVAEPVLVQTRDCAFLNPFADKDGKSHPAALLAYTGVAAQRGLVCWQGEGNVYDKRLHSYALAVVADDKGPTTKAQPHAAWEHLWGPADRKPVLDVPLKATFDLEKLPFDRLALPHLPALKTNPGADLTKLKGGRKEK